MRCATRIDIRIKEVTLELLPGGGCGVRQRADVLQVKLVHTPIKKEKGKRKRMLRGNYFFCERVIWCTAWTTYLAINREYTRKLDYAWDRTASFNINIAMYEVVYVGTIDYGR